MSEPVFIVALAIFAATAIMVAKAIGGAIAGRGAARSGVGDIRERMEQQAAALEEVQANLALQSTQLGELQERVDFAERLLAQARDRQGLGPGDKRG